MHNHSSLSLLCAPLVAAALGWSNPAAAHLDVVFVLDTTGSMGSELQEARTRVIEMAEALSAARPQERVRFGVVAFRDKGDAYITQHSPLSTEIDTTRRFIGGLRADGGGDGPEDVVAALEAALDEDMGWGPGRFAERPVERQVFLVGDAPPHLDYTDRPKPEALYARARAQRVVLNTIGCRSLSQSGIRFFRETAYATEGRYQHIGRVDMDQGSLADSIAETLGGTPEAGPGTPVSVHLSRERGPSAVEGLGATGLLVRPGTWASPLDKEPVSVDQTCNFTVFLPPGTALEGTPVVAEHRDRLGVSLPLGPGGGGRQVYELGRCVAPTLPIHVSFEG